MDSITTGCTHDGVLANDIITQTGKPFKTDQHGHTQQSQAEASDLVNIEFFIRCQPQGASTKPLIIKKGKSGSIVNLLSDSHIPERRMSKLHLGTEQSQSKQQVTERKANISRRGET